MRIRTIVLLSLSVLVLLGVGLFFAMKMARRPPNIILISIDTWRGDYFTPEHMPALYDYASAKCKIFTNAHANSTWTKPSHLTMLTGLLQSEHGVEYEDSAIPPSLTMVQNKLKDAGYTTAAFVGGGFVSQEWGFERGFDTYWETHSAERDSHRNSETFGQKYARNMESFEEAEQYLSSNPGQPAFLFVHTYLVHEYWNLYFPEDQAMAVVSEELRRDKRFADVNRPPLGKFMNDALPEERRELYARAVKDCDRRLTQFLSVLERSPVFSNAKVIITSDHGESLRDIHEEYVGKMHAESPYSDQTHVPMIIYGLGAGKEDRLVGIDDVAGTILKLAGIDNNPQRSLFRERDFVISEYVYHPGGESNRAVAVIMDHEKFLLARDGNLRLFQDAQDQNDLIDSHASPFVGWAAFEGLYVEEGPYPQWDMPAIVRWGYGPRTIVKFIGDGGRAQLVLGFRRNNHQDQTFTVSLNGERLDEFEFGPRLAFHLSKIPIQTIKGENTLAFEYSRTQGDRKLTVCFDRIMVLPEPVDRHLNEKLNEIFLQRHPFEGWDKASGLRPQSGPFPDVGLPVVRWGLGPRTELEFESTGEPLVLSLSCGPHHVSGQEVTVLLNGERISSITFAERYTSEDVVIPITPRAGSNRLRFDYRTWSKSDPDNPLALAFRRLRIEPPGRAAVQETAEDGT